jgi:hypothetical protein
MNGFKVHLMCGVRTNIGPARRLFASLHKRRKPHELVRSNSAGKPSSSRRSATQPSTNVSLGRRAAFRLRKRARQREERDAERERRVNEQRQRYIKPQPVITSKAEKRAARQRDRAAARSYRV